LYPEDRVLVALVPSPADFEIVRQQGWYRIPQRNAPKGLHAEYFAFYFGSQFGIQKWAIHYFARQTGYELLKRVDLFPDQPKHARANELYYKVSLGPLQELAQPIVSLRLRRITFMHTTWDRFRDAREINDLFIEGGTYVDRLYATLKEQGLRPQRDYRIEESGITYVVPISVLCQDGRVDVHVERLPQSDEEVEIVASMIGKEVTRKGGVERPKE
jgi:hypothetical protein